MQHVHTQAHDTLAGVHAGPVRQPASSSQQAAANSLPFGSAALSPSGKQKPAQLHLWPGLGAIAGVAEQGRQHGNAQTGDVQQQPATPSLLRRLRQLSLPKECAHSAAPGTPRNQLNNGVTTQGKVHSPRTQLHSPRTPKGSKRSAGSPGAGAERSAPSALQVLSAEVDQSAATAKVHRSLKEMLVPVVPHRSNVPHVTSYCSCKSTDIQ